MSLLVALVFASSSINAQTFKSVSEAVDALTLELNALGGINNSYPDSYSKVPGSSVKASYVRRVIQNIQNANDTSVGLSNANDAYDGRGLTASSNTSLAEIRNRVFVILTN